MFMTAYVSALLGLVGSALAAGSRNITFQNPVLPGFHPDPSCIFLKDHGGIFLCATSSFNSFPGIPLHASRDLKNWKLVGHVLNRPEQLPALAETNRSTAGIWAPTIREHNGDFWVLTTLVIFKGSDPFDDESWSNAIHFEYEGYDPSPWWDDDGQAYIVAGHSWRVAQSIDLAEADLDTGEVGEWRSIWGGTGGMAPEGPHIYRKDGYHYLIAAEGGTGVGHMVTVARSRDLWGPYEANPANPILSNANTTEYFQTVGHADLVQDGNGNWWCFALSTRSGPGYLHYPMGRETVLAAASWEEGQWPAVDPVRGDMTGWPVRPRSGHIPGQGPYTGRDDNLDFPPDAPLPAHLTHWRFPVTASYTPSPPSHPNTLRLLPSRLNLTALNGNYAGPAGQTLVSRRQQHTLFRFSVTLDFAPTRQGEEAGVTAFLTQNHHLDLGVVLLPAEGSGALALHWRFRAESYVAVPETLVVPVPEAWTGGKLRLEISAANSTHFWFSAGPDGRRSEMRTLMVASNEPVSWGFTGLLLGVYATTNGGDGDTPAYISNWRYRGFEQYLD
ncbi:hypothetical protein S40288_04483 [Stachybotrys chartarum IBT 40288]|nr:hypothetical protein S40288_04483 [Stachybotrys chartarum IBT 40288]